MIGKIVTSNGKQFTDTREMLRVVARDERWPDGPDVVAGISARFSKFAFVLFCYITNHLMTGPFGNSEFVRIFRIEILGKQNSLFPKGQAIN